MTAEVQAAPGFTPKPAMSASASSSCSSSSVGNTAVLVSNRSVMRRSLVDRTLSRVEAGSIRGSIFSLCCSAIGMGVMVLPYNMAQVGPLTALVLLFAASLACLASLRICCAGMHATHSRTYVETLTILFSRRAAAALTTMLVIACFGLCCGYFVFASQLVQQLLKVSGAPSAVCDRGLIVAVAACLTGPLSLYRSLSDFRYLTILSLAGLSSLTLLVIVRTPHYITTSNLQPGWWWRVQDVSALPKCLSLCFTAYTVHMNVFACYDELTIPTPARINKVLLRSTYVQSVLYISIALCGFLSFGANTPDNILRAYDLTDPFANLGRVFVSFQLLLAIPLTVHPGRTYLWPLVCMATGNFNTNSPACGSSSISSSSSMNPAPLVASRCDPPTDFAPTHVVDEAGQSTACASSPATSGADMTPAMPLRVHALITLGFVLLSALVAANVESASDLLGIVGGFAAVTYAFLLPAEIVKKLRANRETIDWNTSPAQFIQGSTGPIAITGLRLCCVFGYIAATQCAVRMLTGG